MKGEDIINHKFAPDYKCPIEARLAHSSCPVSVAILYGSRSTVAVIAQIWNMVDVKWITINFLSVWSIHVSLAWDVPLSVFILSSAVPLKFTNHYQQMNAWFYVQIRSSTDLSKYYTANTGIKSCMQILWIVFRLHESPTWLDEESLIEYIKRLWIHCVSQLV